MQSARSSKYSQLLVLLFLWSCYSVLDGHGFVEDTVILVCDKAGTVYLYDLCVRIHKKENPWCLASYDTEQEKFTHGSATQAGRGVTPATIQFTYYDDQLNIHSSVICTPLQEFYAYDTHTWIPAYRLQPGDRLFSTHGFCVVESVENCIGTQTVYLIEIEKTHTFFVGRSGLLTHNMGLPYAVNVGLSIPLGLAAGSSMGGFFGPITLVAGAVIGSAIGVAAQIICGNRLTEYKVGIPTAEWGDYLYSNDTQTPSNKNPPQSNNVNGPNNNKQHKKDNNNKKILEAVKSAKDAADKIAEDAQKQRRIQPLSKTEAAAKIKNRYEHFDQNIYRLRDGKEPLRTPEGKAIERIEWDGNHFGEWEVYADFKGKNHLGALDPETLTLYKPRVVGRKGSN